MISFHIAYCVNTSITTLEACCSEFNQLGQQACVMGCAVIKELVDCSKHNLLCRFHASGKKFGKETPIQLTAGGEGDGRACCTCCANVNFLLQTSHGKEALMWKDCHLCLI